MTNLGLNALTDDQMVELAREIAAEFANRSPATVDAAKAAIAAATARAIDDQDLIWTQKKWLAAMVVEHLGPRWTLNVWLSPDASVARVYLERASQSSRKRDADGIKYTLHVTGDTRAAPSEITVISDLNKDDRPPARLVRLICEHAARLFSTGVRIYCDQDAKKKYDIPPLPDDFSQALADIKAEKEAAEARELYSKKIRNDIFSECEAERKRLVEDGLKPFMIPDFAEKYAATQAAFNAAMAEYDAAHGGAK